MLKRIGVSAFLLGMSVSQAFAGLNHAISTGEHESSAHDIAGNVVAGHLAHGAAAAAEHHAGGLPQLDPSSYPGQAFWLVVVFVFMYVFFAKKTVPQYTRTIENRAERISNDLEAAEKLKTEVAELQQSYEEKMAQAREEAFAVFKNSEKEIKKDTERRTMAFQERSRKQVEELEANIEKALSVTMEEMSDVAAEVALQASEKIIGVTVDKNTAKSIVKSLNKATA